jgi:hypothetical protein
MKRKVKNSREEYISRASIHHSNNDGQNRYVNPIEAESNDSNRYRQAVIEESWYINFNVTDDLYQHRKLLIIKRYLIKI